MQHRNGSVAAGEKTAVRSDAGAVRNDGNGGVVDCALYVDGVRQGGTRSFTDLYEQARRTPSAFVWIGLHQPDEARFTDIAGAFGLHPLAVEDTLSADQRPKLERYDDVVFLVVRAARYVEHSGLSDSCEVIDTGSLRIFVGEQFVITVRHGAVGPLGSVRTDLEAHPEMLARGPWAVVHAIVDRIVDTYVDIAAAVETDLDAMETAVFGAAANATMGQVYQLKRELMEFKGAVVPLARPLAVLLEGRLVTLSKEIRRYFRDVVDHHTRVVEQIAHYDDLLNSILQARLAQVSIDQNGDMRKIASWAAIAAVQTAIAGIYGMNFTYMPELNWRYGYPAVLTIMLVSSVLLYRRLRRAGWL